MTLKLGGRRTALEAAIDRRVRHELDPRRLAVALAIGVSVALAAACLWQASAVRHDEVVQRQVENTREWAAGETRNATTRATSAGSPIRPHGTRRAVCSLE